MVDLNKLLLLLVNMLYVSIKWTIDYTNCKSVNSFLDMYNSRTTKNNYRCNLNRYFKWLDIRPDEYIKQDRDFDKDIINYEKFNSKLQTDDDGNEWFIAPLTKKEGAIKESIIKTNYIFTISKKMIEKNLFCLNMEKKKKVFGELTKKLSALEVD